LRGWASEAIDTLSEITYACSSDDAPTSEPVETLLRYRHELSALIDRRRFLLPNDGRRSMASTRPALTAGGV
jgi:hypothetical protein